MKGSKPFDVFYEGLKSQLGRAGTSVPNNKPTVRPRVVQSASTSSVNGLGTAPVTGSGGGGGGWNPSGGSISISW